MTDRRDIFTIKCHCDTAETGYIHIVIKYHCDSEKRDIFTKLLNTFDKFTM